MNSRQSDIELLFERMALASELAFKAIDRGILCQIKVEPNGLVVAATTGKGNDRLSLQRIVGYPVLKSTKFNALEVTVNEVIETLDNERKQKEL